MVAEGRVPLDPRPRECQSMEVNTKRRRLRPKKCTKDARWRIRIQGRVYIACDTHRGQGVLLGPYRVEGN
jgi:hypothetical protein